MGGGFEKVASKVTSTYEKVKSAVAEKWEGFKKKFEGTKSEMSQEVMDAKSPEDLIALGKKLQEQGEALKLEKDGVEKEEMGNDHEEALKDNETFDKEKAHGEALEENNAFDEAEATKKASEEAEKARIQAEEDAKKIAEDAKKAEELLANIKNGNLGTKKPAEAVSEEKAETEKDIPEGEKIDVIALNNKIVNMGEKARNEALENLTQEEISAVAKNIAQGDSERMIDFLRNFNNKAEIVSQPEITNKFKEILSTGRVHLYNIDRIQNLPGISKEIFSDPEVQKGVQNSIRSFVSYQNSREWPHVKDYIDNVVEGAGISNQGLRDIAEELKGNTEAFQLFVGHFGTKRIYPEIN